jgi:hypothetical protein
MRAILLNASFASLACSPGRLLAQGETTSAIVGVVFDPSVAALPHAIVTAINGETGSKRTAMTDDAGRFSFPHLKPGSYTVKAEAAGFQPQTNLSVFAGYCASWALGPSGRKHLQLGPDHRRVDRALLAVQRIVLRDNGYQSDEGIVYYRKTGQRVRAGFDDALVASTEELIRQVWTTAEHGEIPPPLVDSPKCPGCSLVGICLNRTKRSVRA